MITVHDPRCMHSVKYLIWALRESYPSKEAMNN